MFSIFSTTFTLRSSFFRAIAHLPRIIPPSLPLLLACILGILTAAYSSTDIWLLALLGIGLLLVYTLLAIHNNYQRLLHCLLIIVIGIGGNWRYQQTMSSFDHFYTLTSPNPVGIRAQIIAINALNHQRYSYTVLLLVQEIKLHEQSTAWQPYSCQIQIYTKKKPHFSVCDYIELHDLNFKKPASEKFCAYLMKEETVATLFQPCIKYILLHRPTWSLYRTIHDKKNELLENIGSKCNKQTHALFSSLFLGNRQVDKQEFETTKQQFSIWGLSHYLARSGLHMVIFSAACDYLVRFIPLALIYKQFFNLCIGFLYLLLSWTSISFIRAFIMFVLYKLCIILLLRIQVVPIITIVSLLVLFFNPIQLFFLDFQLSFGLTYALAWIGMQNYKNSRKLAKY